MKTSLQQLLTGLGVCWAFAQLPGCMPLTGTGTVPHWYPNQPIGIYNPQPSPWYPIASPSPFPGQPGMPIVTLPTPGSGPIAGPVSPFPPGLPQPGLPQPDPTLPDPSPWNPDGPSTIPVAAPMPAPLEPEEGSDEFWSPWPLPPRANQLAVRGVGYPRDGFAEPRTFESRGQHGVSRPLFDQFSGGAGTATSSENLKYRGGKVIRNLSYVNLYISGDTDWSTSDVERIDRNLSLAMIDEHLNNVLLQYFDNQPIRSTALPSHPLVGHTPKIVTRGDIESYVTYLHQQGFLRSFDLSNTVMNLILPSGTVLTTDRDRGDSELARSDGQANRDPEFVSESENVDSEAGLGGYHGSAISRNGEKLYYAAIVYSERFSNGATNGIPVFSESWKNVVATLYHQMIEVRTNPDVEDAIRDPSELNSDRTLGWVSDSGLEIGDLPVRANLPITSVIREVPLANGNGTVPVQLPYSNFAGGPEGPILQPHPLPSR